MRVIGISTEKGAEETGLRRFAHDKAGREINLMAQPFDEDRPALFDQLGRANIALMLSWHEGFSLTGWEAIAAEVPLIVSRQSGLYRLVDEALGDPGTACFRTIDVQGQEGDDDTSNFTQPDEDATRDAILRIASELPRAQENARLLKKLLKEKLVCTWENTARQFCEGLGLKTDQPPSTISTSLPQDHSAPPRSGVVVEERRADQPITEPLPPLIALPERPWPDSPTVEMPDSLMLLPQQEIVPFHSYRQGLLNEVLDWALAEDQPIKLRLQAGQGGTGKTRVAIEACHRLESEHHWRTGFLRASESLEADFRKFLREQSDCLVVVDYAETRTGDVITLTRAALKVSPKGKVGLLLLARDGGDWWDRLADSAKDDAAVAALLRSPRTKTGPYRMSEQSIELDARSTVFQEALASFAKAKRQEIPAVATPDLSANHFDQLLFIHLAALASLRGFQATGDRELLDMAVGHERAYWRYLLEGSGPGEAWFDALEQAVALLTLFGGDSSAREAKAALGRTPRLRGTSLNIKNQIFDLLRRLYRRAGGLSGLQPDLLGEHLVAAALARDDEIIDVALEDGSTSEQAATALTILTRLAKRDRAGERWLARALDRHLPRRMSEAFEVAIETGSPMPEMIAARLRSAERSTQRRLVKSLRPQLPEETVNLKGLAIDIAEHHMIFLKAEKGDRKGWKAAKQFKNAYENLASRHAAEGRLSEAAEARDRALFHAGIMARAGKPAERASVGVAHANYAAALSRIGDFEGALEHAQSAEVIHRELAESQPDLYRADFASTLSNVGRHLGELGRYKEALVKAEEAEVIHRELAELQPDRYRAHFASTLFNVSKHLGELGRYEAALGKAEEAEAIYGDFVERQLDTYRDDWAVLLGSVGVCLGRLGRHEEALAKEQRGEAILRELAERQPDAYRASWAASLGNIGNRMREFGRYKEALAFEKRAELIYQELVEREPDAYRADLALALGNVAENATRCGQASEAVTSARRGTDLLRPLALKYANENRVRLGWCTRVLAEALLAIGDDSQALEQAQEAKRILGDIFAERPAYASEQYGKALPVLARAQFAVEGKGAAVETLVRGIELILPFFEQRPRALHGVMDLLVRTLREIDPVAGEDRVPAELVEQLDALSGDTHSSQTS